MNFNRFWGKQLWPVCGAVAPPPARGSGPAASARRFGDDDNRQGEPACRITGGIRRERTMQASEQSAERRP